MAGIKGYWTLAAAAIAFRILLLFCLPKDFQLGSHPEITTPLTSLRRRTKPRRLLRLLSSSYHLHSLTSFVFGFCSYSGGRLLAQAGVHVALLRSVHFHEFLQANGISCSFLGHIASTILCNKMNLMCYRNDH